MKVPLRASYLGFSKKSSSSMVPFCIATSSPVGRTTKPATLNHPAADPIDRMLSGISLESNSSVSGLDLDLDQMSRCPDSSLETILRDPGSNLTDRILKYWEKPFPSTD